MSDDEIKTFITTFKSFMQHADVEEMNYLQSLHASINSCTIRTKQRNIMFLMTITFQNLPEHYESQVQS